MRLLVYNREEIEVKALRATSYCQEKNWGYVTKFYVSGQDI
jgi:hypothetical protein